MGEHLINGSHTLFTRPDSDRGKLKSKKNTSTGVNTIGPNSTGNTSTGTIAKETPEER